MHTIILNSNIFLTEPFLCCRGGERGGGEEFIDRVYHLDNFEMSRNFYGLEKSGKLKFFEEKIGEIRKFCFKSRGDMNILRESRENLKFLRM